MRMYLPPGEWGESDTAYTKGEVISLQLLDDETETVSFTYLPAYKTVRFNLGELCVAFRLPNETIWRHSILQA